MAKVKADIWMPLYIGDYLADTMHLTTEQHGAYLLLIMAYWKNGGPLPGSDSSLASISRLSGDAWSNAKAMLVHFFDVDEVSGTWKHERIDQELVDAAGNKERRVSKAKKAAEARWGNGATGNAPSMPRAMHGECPSPSPSPSKELVPKGTCAKQGEHEDSFAIFWKLYPQKKARKEALKSWMKIKPTGDLLNQIMNGLAAQRASADWTKDGGQFVPHASTWLNNSRWEDEVRYGQQDSRTSSGPASLVDQVRERNREREAQRAGDFGGEDRFRTFDGEVVGIDDEHVRPQMDLSAWT